MFRRLPLGKYTLLSFLLTLFFHLAVSFLVLKGLKLFSARENKPLQILVSLTTPLEDLSPKERPASLRKVLPRESFFTPKTKAEPFNQGPQMVSFVKIPDPIPQSDPPSESKSESKEWQSAEEKKKNLGEETFKDPQSTLPVTTLKLKEKGPGISHSKVDFNSSLTPSALSPSQGKDVPNQEDFWIIAKLVRENLEYPYLARRLGHQGKIILSFILNPKGEVSELKILKSSGYDMLDSEALRAVNRVKTKFPKPQKTVVVTLPIVFQLEK